MTAGWKGLSGSGHGLIEIPGTGLGCGGTDENCQSGWPVLDEIRTVYLSNVRFFSVSYTPALPLRLQCRALLQDMACDLTYVCLSRTKGMMCQARQWQ